MARFNPKWIIGRTIVACDMRPFQANDPTLKGTKETAHDPVITLDNGAKLYFQTEETEIGEYGTSVVYVPPRKKKHKEEG